MFHSKKHAVIIIAVIVAAITSLLFIPVGGKRAFSDRDGKRNSIIMMRALTEVIKKSERNFYKEVDREKMYEGAIKGALAALGDSYSRYLSPRIRQRGVEDLYDGAFGGLGIEIYEDKGYMKISRPLRNSPALRVGLQAGDYITKVNGEPSQYRVWRTVTPRCCGYFERKSWDSSHDYRPTPWGILSRLM